MNRHTSRDVCRAFDMVGYPMIALIVDRKYYLYFGKRNEQSIVEFANSTRVPEDGVQLPSGYAPCQVEGESLARE